MRHTSSRYQHDSNNAYGDLAAHIVNRVTSQIVYDGSGNTVSQTSTVYDIPAPAGTSGIVRHDYTNYPASNSIRGNPTQISHWLNTNNSWLPTQLRYDDTGNLTSSTDPGGHQTSFSYADSWDNTTCLPVGGTGNAYVTSVTNALSQISGTKYNSCTGTKASSTDANNQTTTFAYNDSLDRLTQTTLPPDATGFRGQTTVTYKDAPLPLAITTSVAVSPTVTEVSTVTMDGLGRTAQTAQTSDPDGVTYAVTNYDFAGRESKVYNPTRCQTPTTNCGEATWGYQTFTYDPLGRLTDLTKQDGNVVHTDFVGNATTVKDESGRQRRSINDALGRMVEADEPGDPATAASTNVASFQTAGNLVVYNVLGQPLWASPWFGSVGPLYILSMQYDGNLVEYTPTWGTTLGGAIGPFTTYPPLSCTSDTLMSGQNLASGGCIVSLNGRFVAIMQTPGNLVVYDRSYNPWVPVWANSGTGTAGSYLAMQSDGNLVIYTSTSVPVWASNTSAGFGAYALKIQDQGNLVIYQAKWATGTVQTAVSQGNWAPWNCTDVSQTSSLGKVIYGGTTLTGGQCVISSNGRFAVQMQGDGNLVIYDRSTSPFRPLWNSGTNLQPFDPGLVRATIYTYDALGNMTCAEQHGNVPGTGCSSSPSSDASSPWRVRRFTYDSLARLLSTKNPESGTINYQYDVDGNVTTKTDARGVVTNYSPAGGVIDALHRVTHINYSDGTPSVTFQYDTACCGVTPENPIGRMTAAFAGNTELVFSYDQLGRVKTQWDCPPSGLARGSCYTIGAQYDAAGGLTSLTYPDGRVVTTSYTAAGRLAGVKLASYGGNPVNVNYYSVPQGTSSATWGYFPSGAMNRGTYGNGFVETTGYNNRLQISSIVDAKGATTLFSKSFGFYDGGGHNNGDILSITDQLTSAHNQTFTYDSLNRILTGLQSDNAFNVAYSYDAWGNMKESGTSNFQPLFDVNNRMVASGGCSPNLTAYCYDAAGDLLVDNKGHAYTYDGEARIKTVDGSGNSYTYNGAGSRVRKDTTAGSTEYLFFGGAPIAELNPTSGAWTDYIFAGTKRIAKDTSNNAGGAQYYHDDQIGSARVMTDSAGTKIADCTFNPFGEKVFCSPDNASNHYWFTGKERDSEDGLDDFGARYFSSSMGRWMTPDWSARPTAVPYAVFGDPQSLNLYLYVRNDPITNADADGHADGDATDPQKEQAKQAEQEEFQRELEEFYKNHPWVKSWDDFMDKVDNLVGGHGFKSNEQVSAEDAQARAEWGQKYPGVPYPELRIGIVAPDGLGSGSGAAETGETLSRYVTSKESVSRLAKKAAEAEEGIGIHGVSTTAGKATGAVSAPRSAVERVFKVHNTPSKLDPLHRTVELPKPVTQAIADLFNKLFGWL